MTGSSSGPFATVLIVNWNGAALLPDCLRALAAQDLPRSCWQAWVVDNGSTDDSVQLLERDFPDVRVIRNPRNDGFAGGNNVGLRQVRTPYAVLLNNDARPAPDWLRRLLAPLQAPGQERLAAVTSKIVFLPRFLPLDLRTPGFRPDTADTRELGVRLWRLAVTPAVSESAPDPVDVTELALWDDVAFGPEGTGDGRFRWTRPTGRLLVPVCPATADRAVGRDLRVVLRADAERAKELDVAWAGGQAVLPVSAQPADLAVDVPPDARLVDVVNNVGGVIFVDGYGADRGYQQVDHGQYDAPTDVLAFCGAAAALRMAALREVGLFDDDFFLYYEDTDLSWRLQAAGWSVRYVPDAVVRHIHAASSQEWSPLFVFHVDRNRLLMLTKNASAGLALRAVLRYPLTTASMARTAIKQGLVARRRPPVRPTLLRLRVMASYLRLLPVTLRHRRAIGRRAVVDRRSIERRLTPRPGAGR